MQHLDYQAKAYEPNENDQQRISALLSLIPQNQKSILEIGAASGQMTLLLTDLFEHITALDLQKPLLIHEKVTAVEGDITKLTFSDQSFDVVLCAEVLEHVPPLLLLQACREIARVARSWIIIGVPYKEDLRIGRTSCSSCGKVSPPWGHQNTFDEPRLKALFPTIIHSKTEFIGQRCSRTNWLASALMDLALNPWGDYDPRIRCMYCGNKLSPPIHRTVLHKVLAKMSYIITKMQTPFVKPVPEWIHVLFKKEAPT